MFPGGTEESKFSDPEVVALLEYAVLAAWYIQFNLKGYTPTDGTKAKFIAECEAIEQNHVFEKNDQEKKKFDNKKNVKFSSSAGGSDKMDVQRKSHYCTHHGKNSTHGTADCLVLKNKARTKGSAGTKRTFSNNGLRKEINTLARGSSKKKFTTCIRPLSLASRLNSRRKITKRKRLQWWKR
jgi:hypothetical protein